MRLAAEHVRGWSVSESVSADVAGRAGQAAELQGRKPEAPQPPQHRQARAPLLSTLHSPNPVNPICYQPGIADGGLHGCIDQEMQVTVH